MSGGNSRQRSQARYRMKRDAILALQDALQQVTVVGCVTEDMNRRVQRTLAKVTRGRN